MDEAEWLESTDPAAMLDFVTRRPQQPAATNRRRISSRKLRLFACACCRQVWHLLADPRSREAVEVAERFADDKPPMPFSVMHEARRQARVGDGWVWCATGGDIAVCLRQIVYSACQDIPPGWPSPTKAELANLLRDIVGNPFRPVMLPLTRTCWKCGGASPSQNVGANATLCACGIWHDGPATCPWLTPLVVSTAKGVYAEPLADGTLCPTGLGMVSDALEEAGCPTHEECSTCVKRPGFRRMYPRDQLPGSPPVYGTCWDCGDRVSWNAFKEGYRRGDPSSKGSGKRPNPLLTHLRSPGPHYRGMWSLDLLLGKE